MHSCHVIALCQKWIWHSRPERERNCAVACLSTEVWCCISQQSWKIASIIPCHTALIWHCWLQEGNINALLIFLSHFASWFCPALRIFRLPVLILLSLSSSLSPLSLLLWSFPLLHDLFLFFMVSLSYLYGLSLFPSFLSCSSPL